MGRVSDIPLSVAGDGCLRLLVNHGTGNVRGPTRVLASKRVTHVSNLGVYSMLSTKRLAQSFDAPMRVYLAAIIIHTRSGGTPLIFRLLRSEKGLLEIKVRHNVAASDRAQRQAAASLLVAARRRLQDIMEFYKIATRQTAVMAGIQLSGI